MLTGLLTSPAWVSAPTINTRLLKEGMPVMALLMGSFSEVRLSLPAALVMTASV